MIILIWVLSFILCGISGFLGDKSPKNDNIYEEVFVVLFAFVNVVSFIILIGLTIKCSNRSKIEDIIAMYEEENQSIENKMDDLVKGYMDYEKNTLTEFAPESSITLVSLYPELKSDELVQKQIDVYMNNNSKIKELKERKIYRSVYRWWLYFGG